MPGRMLVGVDTGAQGGVAAYTETFEASGVGPSWSVEKLSSGLHDRFDQFSSLALRADQLEAPRVAVLETVSGFAGVGHPGARMFNFGVGVGQIEGILVSLGYQIIRVRPQAWQKQLSLLTRKDESKPEHKRRLRSAARDLFPKLEVTLWTCDALLILWAYLKQT